MGHLRKPEVRELAKRHGLPTAETPESQDACLVAPGESFAEMLRTRFAAPARPGEIVGEAGHVVGEHAGIHAFTIGQRKGLPAGATARRWVKAISPESGQVTITSDPRPTHEGHHLPDRQPSSTTASASSVGGGSRHPRSAVSPGWIPCV